MEQLRYTVIKSADQYQQYCQRLRELLFAPPGGATPADSDEDEADLLTLLIEKWDAQHSPLPEQDPITLLKSLLAAHQLKAKDLSALLGVSKSLASDILNRKRGLSKEVIRKLAARFAFSQEAFNRPYALLNDANGRLRDAKVMNTRKQLEAA